MKRTHKCGELRLGQTGQRVCLCGWVAKRRDLGGMIFLDLRDRWGLVQVVYYPGSPGYQKADQVRAEYVLCLQGVVQPREGNVNPEMPTGEIEVAGGETEILNQASLPPFYIQDQVDVDENLRLRYRYLDLRRPFMQANLLLRSKAAAIFRRFLAAHDFIEVETPYLAKSTPEGARDFLVPSRVHPGKFYALPQSPQLQKQLLMVAGLERYYQLARCFRDEDLRADRQLEFTQVDIEVSFMEQEDFFALMEELLGQLFGEIKGVQLPQTFPRLTWHAAMEKYGSDKPDLRFCLEIVDISALAAIKSFPVFADVVAAGGSVRGLKAPAVFSRKDLEQLTEQVKAFGAKGLAWAIVENEGLRSPLAKYFTPQEIEDLRAAFSAKEGDTLLLVADADAYGVVLPALGALRVKLGTQLGLADNSYQPLWVVNFPLFEYNREEGRYVAAHHPFTAPLSEDFGKLKSDPAGVRAQAYDLVLNGWELASGSVRPHQADQQLAILEAIGLDREQAEAQFGFLLEALGAGAPPHRGIALGFDRLVAILAGESSIRNVIAFPKTNSAVDPMTEAPSPVDTKQLAELKITVNRD